MCSRLPIASEVYLSGKVMVDKPPMEFRSLGQSGLKVSVFSFGNMNSGILPDDTESWSFEATQKCLDAGVNFIDTAEIYGMGKAEIVLGKNLKQGGWDRDDLIISDKLMPVGGGIQGISRKHIREGMAKSLERLQLSNIDVLFLHRFDHEVPLEETIRAINHLIDEDYAYYWGTSEFTPQQLVECHQICEKYGLIHPIVEQCEYSLVSRQHLEVDYIPLLDYYGMGTTIWSPLAGGLLTGRFNDGAIPEDSRIKASKQLGFLLTRIHDIRLKKCGVESLRALKVLADELGCTQAQLALAWTVKNPNVTTAMFGVSRPSQVTDNIQALEVIKKLTPEILERIEGFMSARPETPFNWRTMSPFPPRR